MNSQGAPTMGSGVRLPGLNLNLPFSSCVLDKWPNSSVSHFPYLLNFHSTYTHPLHETIKKMDRKKRKENRYHFVSCQGHDNCSANVASTSQWWLPRSWLHEGASWRVSPPCVLLRALKSLRALSSLYWLLLIISFGQDTPHFHLSLELVLQPESMESLSSHVLPWELCGNKPEVVPLKYMTIVTLDVGRTFLLLSHRAHPQRGTSAV